MALTDAVSRAASAEAALVELKFQSEAAAADYEDATLELESRLSERVRPILQ
jgi:hypothetical protein